MERHGQAASFSREEVARNVARGRLIPSYCTTKKRGWEHATNRIPVILCPWIDRLLIDRLESKDIWSVKEKRGYEDCRVRGDLDYGYRVTQCDVIYRGRL